MSASRLQVEDPKKIHLAIFQAALIWEIFRREENIKTLTWKLFSRILRQIRLRALYTAREIQVKVFIQNFKRPMKWLGFQILLF